MRLYHHPPKDGRVLCLDEKGTIAIKVYGGGRWGYHRPIIPDKQDVRGTVECIGLYDPHKGQLFVRFYPKKSAKEVISTIKAYRKELRYWGKIYLIIDNWSAHISFEFQKFVKSDGKIILVWTPLRNSWLNAIEPMFSLIHERCLKGSNYHQKRTLIWTVHKFVRRRNREMLRDYRNGRHQFRFSYTLRNVSGQNS